MNLEISSATKSDLCSHGVLEQSQDSCPSCNLGNSGELQKFKMAAIKKIDFKKMLVIPLA